MAEKKAAVSNSRCKGKGRPKEEKHGEQRVKSECSWSFRMWGKYERKRELNDEVILDRNQCSGLQMVYRKVARSMSEL